MAAYKFSSIKTNSDLEKVIMQLRLRQLPLTVEVINAVRVAIQSPHLDEKLHKTLEREFSAQWKEIQKKNNLAEWPKNQWGNKLETKQPVVNMTIRTSLNHAGEQQKVSKIQQITSKIKQALPKIKQVAPKLKQIASKKIKKTKKKDLQPEKKVKPNWKFPIKLNLPECIETIPQIKAILFDLRRYPQNITYNLTHDIASRIKVRKVFDYYKEELAEIRRVLEFEEMKRKSNQLLAIEQEERKRIAQRSSYKMDSFVIERASEKDSLYDNFEYGLSDWDR